MDNTAVEQRERDIGLYVTRACTRLGLDFNEVFSKHFYTTNGGHKARPHWQTAKLGSTELHAAPDLDLHRLTTIDGEVVGLALGIVLSPNGKPVAKTVVAPSDPAGLESFIEDLKGRFVVLARFGKDLRHYVDPSSSFVTYYSPETRRLGSAVALVLDRDIETYDRPAGPFMFGDTADREARRLLSNHYLDLNSFEAKRHWPKPDSSFLPPANLPRHLDTFFQQQRENLDTLTSAWSCAMPITGGRDSRLLLACAKPFHSRIQQFYTHVQNQSSFLDSLVAASVCERMNLPHTSASLKSVGQVSQDVFEAQKRYVAFRGSGQVTAGENVLRAAMLAPKGSELLLRGGLIELTRSITWGAPHGDNPLVPVDPREGIAACTHALGAEREFLDASVSRYEEWRDTLPPDARGRATDFAVVEQRAPTGNHVFYSAFSTPMMINAFNDRRALHAIFRLPIKFRRNHRPQNYLIRRFAPELRDIPYVSYDLQLAVRKSGLPKLLGRNWR